MVIFIVKLWSFMVIVKVALSQRRITNGTAVDDSINTNFMVYIVRAIESDNDWLCSGTIIHPELILTSASCLSGKLYAVAGYNTYVPTRDLETDQCTKMLKKKLITFCKPEKYKNVRENWMEFDMAIAKPDTPFDFYDIDYEKYCSYIPNKAMVLLGMDTYYRKGTNMVTFGWGHSKYQNPPGEKTDLNQKKLNYASVITMDLETCANLSVSPKIKDIIQNVMICLDGEKGATDGSGVLRDINLPTRAKCNRRFGTSGSNGSFENCDPENITAEPQVNFTKTNTLTRRHGPCENDHGSPLIGWVNGRPYVMGVATTATILPTMACTGPYLYNSCKANSRFLTCIMSSLNTSLAERGGDVRRCGDEKLIVINPTWHD